MLKELSGEMNKEKEQPLKNVSDQSSSAAKLTPLSR